MGKAENYVEQYLKDQAKQYDCLCFKFVSYGTRGVPDRVIIGHGLTVFVETKSDHGHLSKQQKYRIYQMRMHGAIVAVAYTREQVDELYQNIIHHNTERLEDTACYGKP